MSQPEVVVNNTKINGNTQITLNLKTIFVLVGLIISIGGTIFGVVTSKLNKLDAKIIKLDDEDVESIKDQLKTVNAQNTFIMKYYNIDVDFDAEQSAEARRNADGKPTILGYSN